jgi:hypothetical protein
VISEVSHANLTAVTDNRWGLLFFLVTVGCGGVAPSDAGADGGGTFGGATEASGATVAESQAGMGGCFLGGATYKAGDTIRLSDCDSCRCLGNGQDNCARSQLIIPPVCEYADGVWTEGSVVPVTDNCNSCTCQTVNIAHCTFKTEMSCTTNDCTSSCAYAGRFYNNGTSFTSTDGCNECTCVNGVVDCTQNDCNCFTAQYWRLYRLTDANQCAAAVLNCPIGTTEFTNACGCGCEQSPDCPEYARCVSAASGYADTNSYDIPTLPPNCTLPTVCPLSVANAIIQ